MKTPSQENKPSKFEKLTGHRRNRTLEKLISASTIMAPTHDRVVGMDPDDVKTPVSVPTHRSWEKESIINENAPPLPARASTNPKPNGEEDETRPELPSRPSEIAGYGGAELMQDKAKESRDHLRHDLRNGVHKLKNLVHQDPKAAYFSITEKVDNHLKAVYASLCNGETGLRTSGFVKFLREQQGQDIEMPVGKTQMREFGMMGEKRWSYKEWLAFMCRSGALEGVRPVGKAGLVRSDNLGKHEETEEEREAMRYPITSYFIDSSHNTYLQGHQWFSKSTEDAYRYVLVHGCRCIEIDVHNGTSVRDNASGVSSMIKPTAPSELILEASKKKDEIKSKWNDFKVSAKKKYHEKKQSISGNKPPSPRMEEMTREVDMGHRRNQSSASTVPTFSRDPTSDSEGSINVHSEEGSAVDLTADGKPTSEKSSRASSKSSVHPERTGEPIVMHGWTPTTQWCFFRDVCKTVAQYAFETTDMPLIVSLEVACNLDQQELMVRIMKEEWKGMLVDSPLEGCDPAIRQPRLDELFGKILVKVKRHVPHEEEAAANAKTNEKTPNGGVTPASTLVGESSTSTPSASTPNLLIAHLTPSASTASAASITPTATPSAANLSPTASATKLERLDTTSTKSSTHSRSPSNPPKDATKPPKVPKIAKNLSDLGIYTHSAHFADFFHPSAWSPSHIYSIDESSILKLYEEHAAEMHAHNKKYFMRAYPEWKRIGSSNLDPSVYWRKGVQMAAVNAQTWDEGTMVNRGMFEGTGGWVLKPANLRPENKPNGLPTWNPNATTREEAEAGVDGKTVVTPLGTPDTERQMPLSPTTIDSAMDDKTPVGLGLGLESSHPLPEPKVSRATALDPPTPSGRKGRSPRQSNASLGPLPSSSPLSPMSPKSAKSSSTPVSSPKLQGALSALVMQPKMPRREVPKTVNLHFKIYAAQGLLGDTDMHVRVKIEMHAEREGEWKSDDWKKESKSRHTTNPDWNGEEIKFLNIGSKGDPDDHVRGHLTGPRENLSFVRFKLEDDNTLKRDVMLAWRAVRLDRLRTGFRFLRLWNAQGEEGGGLLLIHVRREEV